MWQGTVPTGPSDGCVGQASLHACRSTKGREGSPALANPRADCHPSNDTCVVLHAARQHAFQTRGTQPEATTAGIYICTANSIDLLRAHGRGRYIDSGSQLRGCPCRTSEQGQQMRNGLAGPIASSSLLGGLGRTTAARVPLDDRVGATLQHHDTSTSVQLSDLGQDSRGPLGDCRT